VTRKIVCVLLGLLLMPLLTYGAGPVLYRDTTTKETTRAGGLDIDASGNLALKSGAFLTSTGQVLYLKAAPGYDIYLSTTQGGSILGYYDGGDTAYQFFDGTAGSAPSAIMRLKTTTSAGGLQNSTGNNRFFWDEDSSRIQFNNGDNAMYATDSGVTVLKGKAGTSGGTYIQSIEASVNMLVVDGADTGNIQMRAQSVGDLVTIGDGTGTSRIKVQDSTSFGVQILDSTGTVSMLLADSLGTGDVELRPAAPLDVLRLRDGSGLNRIQITESGILLRDDANTTSMILVDGGGSGETEIRPLATGDQVILRDGLGAARVRVGDTNGITVASASGTVNMLRVDQNANGDVWLQPYAIGDYIRFYSPDNVSKMLITDEATNAYGVSIQSNLSTTGSIKVDRAIRVRGEAFVSTTPFTAETKDSYIYCDTSSASIVVNLPTVATGNGLTFNIKLDTIGTPGRTVTIDADGSETIDGALTYVLNIEKETVTIRAPTTGTDWKVQ